MIDLTPLAAAAHTPRLIDFGGFLTPSTGAAVLRIDRLGNRHAVDFVLPPLRAEPAGRIWASRIKRAKTEGAFMRMPQVDFRPGAAGAPIVAAVTVGGRILSIAGGQAGGVVREGQWLSIVSGGKRYLHSVDAEMQFAQDGTATLQVTPMLRAPLAVGDVVELAQPRIEGIIVDDFSYPVAANRTVSFTFTLTEAA
ncbi:hypothetical protein MOP88_13905 [Sphingomonas sp. WKB10]|nr:hypothetical protein [Sphingomonas sp. WKB10]